MLQFTAVARKAANQLDQARKSRISQPQWILNHIPGDSGITMAIDVAI